MKPHNVLSDADLRSIAAGMNFVVLESKWERNLEAGERMLTVQFSRPVLRRPMTRAISDFVLDCVKHFPRHWVVTVTGHYSDGKTNYTEQVELEAHAKLDWLTEAYKTALEAVSSAGNPKHLLGCSWRARIKTTAERRYNGNARRETANEQSGQTVIDDDGAKKQKRRA